MIDTRAPSDELVRAALYARVSTDDQRERQTIDAQVNALRSFAPHWNIAIADEYLDDGISGTVPMHKRPEGARLMQDAEAGKHDVVIFYRMDRLARSLRNFLDIVDFFEKLDVGLRSMTETFDTTNPMGRFAVQMIAAVAELERGTIIERTSMGRARMAAEGRWTGGVVPYGYLVDEHGHLTPDSTPRNGCSFSEANIIQRIFRMVADESSTATAVARHLNSEGIPLSRKYQPRGQKEPTYKTRRSALWWTSDITRIIHSETYKGTHIWGAEGEKIAREVPPLVDVQTWDRARDQIAVNKRLPRQGQAHPYLLRGLMRCATCGKTYTGALVASKEWSRYYYRCGTQTGARPPGQPRCSSKVIDAEWIENTVWEDIQAFVSNPGDVVHRLQARMESEVNDTPSLEARKRELQRALAAKEIEKDRLLDAYRRGLLDIDTLDKQMQQSREELEPLHSELADITSSAATVGQRVGRLTDAQSLLEDLQDKISGPLDWDTKRQMVEALVWSVNVETTGEGRKKGATLHVTYAFEAGVHAVNDGTSSRAPVANALLVRVGASKTVRLLQPRQLGFADGAQVAPVTAAHNAAQGKQQGQAPRTVAWKIPQPISRQGSRTT